MTIVPLRLAVFVLFPAALWLAGCAGTGWSDEPHGAGSAHTPTGQVIAPQAAMDAITIGKSTKAELSSDLGRAIVVSFDSGYEVWVYRWAGSDRTTRGATELVVLFEPSGVAKKARLRPGYAPRG